MNLYIFIYLCMKIESFDIMIFIMIIMGRVELGGNDYIPPRGEASIGAQWLALYCPTCSMRDWPISLMRAYDTPLVY